MNVDDYEDKFGFSLSLGSGPNLMLFSTGFHWHPADDPEPCSIRFTFQVTIVNLRFEVGILRNYNEMPMPWEL